VRFKRPQQRRDGSDLIIPVEHGLLAVDQSFFMADAQTMCRYPENVSPSAGVCEAPEGKVRRTITELIGDNWLLNPTTLA
jgi:hypothetical protein